MQTTPQIPGFRIERELGRGGMGVVYLAHDTRLDRAVAVKALPEHLSSDPDRLARFQREAKTLASLNHPNIGAIYGLDESDGNQFLVLEYVEGETLADRLVQGPLPLDEALAIARQVADALEAAHEKGVIHRDLKPGNVMITPEGTAKVLDFGLARTADALSSTAFRPESPTIPMQSPHSPTMPGAIMGTAGYMSPEQAKGKAVDRRSDVFSFGCVLFEMLAGERAFEGESVTDSLGAIIHREADWTRLPPTTPARVRELLASCLAKDRRQRLHDIGDARLALERAERGEPEPAQRSSARTHRAREVAAWGIAVAALGAAGWAWVSTRLDTAPGGAGLFTQFHVPAPPGTEIEPEAVNSRISPDGRKIAFLAAEPGKVNRLWVRSFDSLASRALEGTEGAAQPFWSPDSRAVAFFAGGRLLKVPAEGGSIQALADAPSPRGGDWGDSGTILFAPFSNGPLHAVPQAGGAVQTVTTIDSAKAESGHRFPNFLPGGRKFLYASLRSVERQTRQEVTCLGSLDSKEVLEVISAQSRATYAEPGWLLFEQGGQLMAQRFDEQSGKTSGDAVPTGLLPGGATNYGGYYSVSCSRNGVVACPSDGVRKSVIVRMGRDGRITQRLSVPPEVFGFLEVSPVGQQAVVIMERTGASEVRLIELSRAGVMSRITEQNQIYNPTWSHDGSRIYYSADRNNRDLFRCGTSGGDTPELLLETGNQFAYVADVSRDETLVLFNRLDASNQRDLWMLNLSTKEERLMHGGPANEFDARFSPDGKWIAYASDETGQPEIYLQDYPAARVRTRVTTLGMGSFESGTPSTALMHWSADGKGLYFLDAQRRSISFVKVETEPSLKVGQEEVFAQLPADVWWADVSPDGETLLGLVPAEGQSPCALTVTMNWTSALEKHAVTPGR